MSNYKTAASGVSRGGSFLMEHSGRLWNHAAGNFDTQLIWNTENRSGRSGIKVEVSNVSAII